MHSSVKFCRSHLMTAWTLNVEKQFKVKQCLCFCRFSSKVSDFVLNPATATHGHAILDSNSTTCGFLDQDEHRESSKCHTEFIKSKSSMLQCGMRRKPLSEGTMSASKRESSTRFLKIGSDARTKLDEACEFVYNANRPSDEDLSKRQQFCHKLESYLKKHCHEDIQLELFGSSSNGLTFPSSDIDICLTFRECDTDEKVSVSVLTPISKVLSSHSEFFNVSVLYSAQVPIIKFQLENHHFTQGDISLYNRLAVINTSLILTYVKIDHRFRVLGYMLKHLVKKLDNAKRLREYTSYPFILLVIYFLQQCDPPVLPVLQEMQQGKERPLKMVDGWNTWYFKDIDQLPNIWKKYGKNKASVGELWRGMVRFYAEEFDFKNTVVCIRRRSRMTKGMKIRNIDHLLSRSNPLWKRKLVRSKWVKSCMLVEDPFDLGHNLLPNVKVSKDFLELMRNENELLQSMCDGELE